jgi:predicted nucleic acid-binding protein
MKEIADTGLIVALLFRNDPFHRWAREAFGKHAPFITCDVVLAEAASFCPDSSAVLKLVTRGDLIIDPAFSLSEEVSHLAALASKYSDRPMDLADACLVRMSQLHTKCRIWTVDRNVFSTYPRMGKRTIPCEFPPED